MSKLVLVRPDGTTLDIALERERVTIGRRPDNDVCLPYPAVSGEHAAVVTILEDSFLEDLNSTNGTLVNGKQIAKHFLRDRDEIDIGRQKLVYFEDDRARHVLSASLDELVKEAAADPSIASTLPGAPTTPGNLREQPAARTKHSSSIGSAGGRDASEAPPERSQPEAEKAVVETGVPSDIGTAALGSAPHDELPTAATIDTREFDAIAEVASRSAAPLRNETVITVVSGPRAGLAVPMTADELVIGRVGEAVAAIRREETQYRLVPLEGPEVVLLNAATVRAQGDELRVGDAFEIAGTRLTFGR